ncbi:hypothetical protein RJ639_034603 [Escallonia herrerae]|uniref:Pentatricopeptide repeat-containing protein n=1 Tax=Escallonia herrerae TaxID=1293975 RepID=A0AA88WX10_9ASTE|nr:hypothetical protein RJ639_034603 [Escallonia herrerae]
MLALYTRHTTRNTHFPTLSHTLSTTTTSSPPPPPPDPSTLIATLVLNTSPKTLPQTLLAHPVQWTPDLVNKTLKLLWNHGPKALQFFTALHRHPTYTHPTSSFDHAIDIAARMRDYKTLWTLVAQMRARLLGPTRKTFAIITERFVAAGKPDRAVKIFLSMHQHGCQPDLNSFNTLLDVLCKSKRAEMAYRLFKVSREDAKALEIMKEMVERGLEPSLTTYNIMLKGFFRAGQIKEAWEFFLEMKKRECEIDVVTYTTVVHGFGVAGEVKKARKVFDEMVGVGVLPSVVTYTALIQVLCKKDSVETAELVFEEMVRKGYAPDSTTYTVLIRGFCHAEKMDRAMEYLERMEDDECEPNVQMYNVVIRYYCDAGEIEKGLEMFDKMGSGHCLPNLDTYNILVNAMFVRKKSDDLLVAGKLLLEMVERGFLPRKFTFNRVLNGLLLTGNQDLAKEILRLQSKCGRLPRQFRFHAYEGWDLDGHVLDMLRTRLEDLLPTDWSYDTQQEVIMHFYLVLRYVALPTSMLDVVFNCIKLHVEEVNNELFT